MPNKKRPRIGILIAVVAVTLLVSILLSPVNAFTVQGVTFIDTELRSTSADSRQFVETKYPIGDASGLAAFPKDLGQWHTAHEYDWDAIADLLNTNLLLARDYRMPGVYTPVSLLIVQSTNISSFHPAPVCYQAQGFTILANETRVVEIPISNTSWAKRGWLSQDEPRVFKGEVSVKRLIVERHSTAGGLERELNLYFYIKSEHRQIADHVAWVRISMFVPPEGPYDAHEALLGRFAAEVVPRLFDLTPQASAPTVLETLVDKVQAAL